MDMFKDTDGFICKVFISRYIFQGVVMEPDSTLSSDLDFRFWPIERGGVVNWGSDWTTGGGV